MAAAAAAANTGRSKYKCGICGQPKKGHICQAQGGAMATQGEEDVSHERQRLLAKLQQRMGSENGPATNQDSPSPPNSSGSSQLSASSRHGITVNIPEVGVKVEELPAEAEQVSEARPMSMDMGGDGRPMSVDMAPPSPSMGGMPLWTPPAGEGFSANMWAQGPSQLVLTPPAPSPGLSGNQMWQTVMPPSPGNAANSMWGMPASPGIKMGSIDESGVLPWAPPTTAAGTPGFLVAGTPWGATPGTAQTPFWHNQNTPSGTLTNTLWPSE